MRHIKSTLLVLALAAVLPSCKSQYELLLLSNDSDAKYKAAFSYFNEKKYSKAASLFESLSSLTEGTHRDDTVNYYWGLSNYKAKDYYTAEANFDSFIQKYPRSAFASNATYLRLDCLYRSTLRYELDQKPTQKAIAAISDYLSDYPDSEHKSECDNMLTDLNGRLDRKAYEAAKLYYKMEDYLASRVALRNVLKDNSLNIYREDIMYLIAMSSYKYAHLSVPEKRKERYLVFVDDCLNFFGEYPESEYKKELDNVYMRAQKYLGRRVDSDITVGIDPKAEKAFAKEREKHRKEQLKTEKALKKAQKALEKEKKRAEARKIASDAEKNETRISDEGIIK